MLKITNPYLILNLLSCIWPSLTPCGQPANLTLLSVINESSLQGCYQGGTSLTNCNATGHRTNLKNVFFQTVLLLQLGLWSISFFTAHPLPALAQSFFAYSPVQCGWGAYCPKNNYFCCHAEPWPEWNDSTPTRLHYTATSDRILQHDWHSYKR